MAAKIRRAPTLTASAYGTLTARLCDARERRARLARAALGRRLVGVGAGQQRLGRRPLVGEDGEADARADALQAADRAGDRVAEALGQALGLAPARLRGEDAELVAALAHDGVLVADRALHLAGDLAQDLVAGDVAEAIVDGLEAVEVEHEDGQPAAV